MSEIRIAELDEKVDIEDTDLMIIEDAADTKHCTITEFKRGLSGDYSDPERLKFYSSKMTDSIFRNIKTLISTLADKSSVDGLTEQFNSIIAGVTTDSELIAARGAFATLSERLSGERGISDSSYIKFPKMEVETTSLDLFGKGINTELSLLFKNMRTTPFTLDIQSANLFDAVNCASADSGITSTDTGFSLYLPTAGKTAFKVQVADIPLTVGTYYIYLDMGLALGATGITIDVVYTDDTYDTFYLRNNMAIIEFSARKNFKYLSISVLGNLDNAPTGINNNIVIMNNFMITKSNDLSRYTQYNHDTFVNDGLTESTDPDIVYEYTCTADTTFSSAVPFIASYNDTSYTAESLLDMMSSIKEEISPSIDHCGLIEKYGDYIFLNDVINDNESTSEIKIDKINLRNSHTNAKVVLLDYVQGTNPAVRKALNAVTSFTTVTTVSLQLYIDRTLFWNFSDNEGITINISSDTSLTDGLVNYYSKSIPKNSFVQGWNTIKLKMSDFTIYGSPDMSSIKQLQFVISTNAFTAGKEILLNSIILNQVMTPTVLFAFDGTYSTAFDYQYPLLYTNGIPATLFLNDRSTLTKDFMNNICNLAYAYSWDIGDYGCNPDKELLTKDDNPREQYLALKSAKEYLTDNYIGEIKSYSASFGNLRPLTVPILKELGFKIAKASSDSLCSFFSDSDFTMPMSLISNTTTSDAIMSKIDMAVDTGQCIVIYTNNVTEYGDEEAASKTAFETVLNYIIKLSSEGKIQCLTFKDFYDKCVK